MEIDASGRQVLPGALLPSGWRLAAALSAGALWVVAVVVLMPLPGDLRSAVLYRQATHEGLMFLLPLARVALAAGVLLCAHALSRQAHGTARPLVPRGTTNLASPKPWRRAPHLVVAARVLTWVVLLAVVVVADQVASIDLQPGECFRTCAPYPR